MSLNGLDDTKVQEAYNAAIAELGGWFVLKYASRDEVELLDQGTGGIVEIRNAIEKYEEESPLFGFLRYRRRSVLLKYVPEGCSRLVIARLTVHFSAITDRFPHDTLFSIETAKELKDSKLTAACSSHTASASISSSTSSLRRRRLMEIEEDEEEDEHRAKRQSTVLEEQAASPNADEVLATTDKASPSETPSNAARPTLPHQSTSYQSMVTETISRPETSRTNTERSKSPTRDMGIRRTSSSSSRPDMYNFSSSGSNYKPKVKLGPRPSLDSNARSRGAGSSSQFRPISTLPAGLKLFRRGSKKGRERPQSQYPVAPPSMTASSLHPSKDETVSSLINNSRPRTSGRPNTSSGASARGLASPTGSTFSSVSKTPTVTPEKARLMRALELRKKQMSKPSIQQLPPTPVEDQHPGNPSGEASESTNNTPSGAADSTNELSIATTSDSPVSKTAPSDLTRDSSPPSPAGTDRAESTKASSISEATDETVHAAKETVSAAEQASPESQAGDEEPSQLPVEIKNEPANENISASENTTGLKPQRDEVAVGNASAEEKDESYQTEAKSADEPLILSEPSFFVESAPLPNIQEELEGAEDTESVAKSTALPSSPLEYTTVGEIGAPSTVEIPVALTTVTEEESSPGMAEVRELRMPRSKFSLQNLKEDQDVKGPVNTEPAARATETLAELVNRDPQAVVNQVTPESLQELNPTPAQKKRSSTIAAIRTDLATPDRSVANSEIDFDDDLMDELQAAEVQEAQPVQVSKSPVNSVFPPPKQRFDSKRASISTTRTFSSPLDNSTLSPSDATRPNTAQPRSVSAASKYLEKINSQQNAPLAKKVNVGGGIAQRIKALEQLKGAAPPAGSTLTPAVPSPTFFSVRKSHVPSVREGVKSSSVVDRAGSLSRHASPSPPISRTSSITEITKIRDRSSSIISRQEALNALSGGASQQEPIELPSRGRDPTARPALKQTLSTNSQESKPAPAPLLSESSPTKETVVERRSSMTIVKELISPRRGSFASNRRAETADSKDYLPRPDSSSPAATRPPSSRRSSRELSRTSLLSAFSGNSQSPPPNSQDPNRPPSSSENKSNIGTRMLRRMSSSLNNGRKNVASAISPTLREGTETSFATANKGSLPTAPSTSNVATDLGDVNVQFPDTLLWKRRTLSLDTSGNMILNAAQGTKENSKVISKKYHLSEFTRPHEPDFDAQELPNSVALDFKVGGGLQFACEDRAGQAKVLSVLQEAHKTWMNGP